MVRTYERVGVPVAGHCADGAACKNRRDLGEAGRDVQIDQIVEEFSHRSAILPADAGVDGELGTDAPIVRGIGIVDGLTEVFVRVSEGDGATIRNANEEVGEGIAARAGSTLRCCAGE